MSSSKVSSSTGVIGCVLAAIISSALNHSFWWGLFHFFCGWFYVLYAAIVRSEEVVPALKLMFNI